MKKQGLHYFLICIILVMAISSCKKSKVTEETEISGQVLKEDLAGMYQVVDVLENGSDDPYVQKDVLWHIIGDKISIACAEAKLYTLENNKLVIEEAEYSVTEKVKQNTYELSRKTGTSNIRFVLGRTNVTCPDQQQEEEGGANVGIVELDRLYGYGEATTGGQGATTDHTHHFDNGDKFREWLAAREKAKSKVPAIVWLSGTFTKENGRAAGSPWFDIKDTENITIYGTDSFRMQNIGFFLVRSNNIIIRNVYIVMPKADNGADGISMQKSNNVWVDHCTFESVNQTSDYEDGSVDITHASTNVTVSWNHFIKTQKTALVGHSDGATDDVDIKATFHHNFFDQSSSRHPRVRFGTVHVYNNYFNQVSTYGVGSAMEAKVLVEYNSFNAVHLPTDICTFPAKKSGSKWVSNLTGPKAGFLYASDNIYDNKPSNASDPYPFTNVELLAYDGAKLPQPLTRADFVPPYAYIVDAADQVNTIVPAGAGVGKLTGYTQAPLPVDNGGIQGSDPGEGNEDPNPGGGSVSLDNDWYFISSGSADGSHSVSSDKKSVEISGKGKFESGTQVFTVVYREQSGDFEMTAKIDSYTGGADNNQALAGLLFAPSIDASGTEFLHAMGAKGGKTGEYNYSHRLASGGNASRGVLSVPSSNTGMAYIKLRRTGNSYYVSYSLDGGATYGNERSGNFTSLPEKVMVGLAISSGSNSESATGRFSDIKINGQNVSF